MSCEKLSFCASKCSWYTEVSKKPLKKNHNFLCITFNNTQIKKVETEQDTGLIDANSPEFKNFVKFGLITYVIMAIIGLTWEQIFKRIKNSKVKPYSKCNSLTPPP